MLIKELTIEGFRRFRKFRVRDLGRVNLIVGTNNCGKTTVLEAIHLLASDGNLSTLWRTLSRRGEEFVDDEGLTSHSRKIDVRRLFHGHKLETGTKIQIRANAERAGSSLAVEFVENTNSLVGRHGALGLQWQRVGEAPNPVQAQLSRNGGIPSELIKDDIRKMPVNAEFVSGLGAEAVVEMFEDIVLTSDEDLVYEAMHIIEPTIERIATAGMAATAGLRGGILVRCSDSNDRVPIGSFGEGTWRMLGLALALARSKNGILLVDDIDTGLHYSVMEDMWRLVSETAKRLNAQVFATTHSRDCFESLATVCGDRDFEQSEISIQRIERDRQVGVAYSEQEIIAAARNAIEVR